MLFSAEFQKWKEIKIDDDVIGHSLQDVGIPSDFCSVDTDFPGTNTFEQSQSRNGVQYSFNSLESEMISLRQNVILLQNKLNDEADLIKLKEARVAELERELEGLFRQKIETELEYLVISRTIQNWRAAAVKQVTLMEEQKTLATEQAQMVMKLRDSDTKAAMHKSQAEKLDIFHDDVASTNKTLDLQKGVCKYSIYFSIQLVLLVIVFGLYMLQMSSDAVEVVPT